MVKKDKMVVGLIGCGYWGPNILRNLNSLNEIEVAMVAESSSERRKWLNQNYPLIQVVNNHIDLIKNDRIDAVVIATEAKSHYDIAKSALQNSRHVLVEKPLALNSIDSQELIDLSTEFDKILMVGHTFEHNNAVHALKQFMKNDSLGDIYYIYSQRLNLGRIRSDINVMWNLAPHDISILCYILDSLPLRVSATGAAYIQQNIEDVVFIDLEFPGKIKAHIHVSWLDPSKVRKMTVVGSKKMIVYDDISDNKIQVYDKGIDKLDIKMAFPQATDYGEFQLIQRAGDIWIPKVDYKEPLANEIKHFIKCIKGNDL